jgi:hypothetical protein
MHSKAEGIGKNCRSLSAFTIARIVAADTTRASP